MTEKPILFSAPMVCAIIEGRKTQTRRVLKPQPIGMDSFYESAFRKDYGGRICPYGQPGDRLWVREKFTIETNYNLYDEGDPPFKDGRPVKWHDDPDMGRWWSQAHYAATDPMPDLVNEDCPFEKCANEGYCQHWYPSIHMPRWASRITLEITDVRVERLNDITYADCLREGIEDMEENAGKTIAEYAALWDRLNAARGFGWSKNPWVWVVEFKKL